MISHHIYTALAHRQSHRSGGHRLRAGTKSRPVVLRDRLAEARQGH